MTDDERKQFLDDAKEVALIHLKRRQPTHSDVVAKVRSCLEEFVPDYTQAELSRIITEIEYNIRIKTQAEHQEELFREICALSQDSRFPRGGDFPDGARHSPSSGALGESPRTEGQQARSGCRGCTVRQDGELPRLDQSRL